MKYGMPILYGAIQYSNSSYRLNINEFLSKGFSQFFPSLNYFSQFRSKKQLFLLTGQSEATQHNTVVYVFVHTEKMFIVRHLVFKDSTECVSFLGLMNST